MTHDHAVLFLTSDLMFSSRVLGAAKALGVGCKLVADPAQLAERSTADCRLVLVDLALDGLESAGGGRGDSRRRRRRRKIIAYGAARR